jgi:hypothetical protein
MKYFLIVLLGLGVYAGINVVSAGSANKDFAQAVQQIVDRHAGSPTAELDIAAAIRQEADEHGIELGPNAIEVESKRSSIGSDVDYVTAKATVTYDRRIMPFYSKRVKITRVNQWGG